jgi:hypothetical protein
MRIAISSLFLLVLSTLSALSQEESNKRSLKWNLDFTVGPIIGGPNHDFKNAVVDAISFSSISTKNHLVWSLDVSRKITNQLNLEIILSHGQNNLIGPYSEINYFKIYTLSSMVLYNFKDLFQIGAGPALYPISYLWYEYNLYGDENYKKIGALIESSLKFPRNTRFFIRIDTQLRIVGDINNVTFWKMGPHIRYIYTANNIDCNNLYFGFGLGLRI